MQQPWPIPASASAALDSLQEEQQCPDTSRPGTPPSPPGPSAAAEGASQALEGLVADYAAAYAAMKEQLEVRLRHEARRGDHYEARSQQLEGDLREGRAQLEATQR
jgi:hypothetical protein